MSEEDLAPMQKKPEERLSVSSAQLMSSQREQSSRDLAVVAETQEYLGLSAEPEAAQPNQSSWNRRPCCRRHGFLVQVPGLRHQRGDLSILGPRSPSL